MKNMIQFSAGINKIQTMADNTLQIRLETPELPIAQMSQLFNLKRDMCMIGIAPVDVPLEPFDPATLDIPKGKTSSERLYNNLFVLWKKNNDGYDDFQQWRRIKMDEIVSAIQVKIKKYE